MLISVQPLDQNELGVRRKTLRNAVICLGWLKLISVMCYVILYLIVSFNSKGCMSVVLQIMTLATIPLQVVHGILLFLGALEDKLFSIELALWLCLILASYNTVLGIMGAIYFIRTGYLIMHFMLAVIFAIIALTLFTVLCHDIFIVYAYKQLLVSTLQQIPEVVQPKASTQVESS